MSTYEFYEEALNWGSVGKRLSKVLYDVVEEYKEKSK